jgi:hypothetical protein
MVYTYLEVLQGARNDQELKTLEEYLSTQRIISPQQMPVSIEKVL